MQEPDFSEIDKLTYSNLTSYLYNFSTINGLISVIGFVFYLISFSNHLTLIRISAVVRADGLLDKSQKLEGEQA